MQIKWALGAGFTEEYLAEGIVSGSKATDNQGHMPDYRARGIYYKLGAELLDAFPAKKNINADVPIEDMLDDVEGQADYAEWKESDK